MNNITVNTFDYSEESDYDLIEIITWQETDRSESDSAWVELFNRHIRFLIFVLKKKTKNKELSEDIAAETMTKVYEKAAYTFKPEKTDDTVYMRRHVRKWLSKIAKNTLADLYRSKSVKEVNIDIETVLLKKEFEGIVEHITVDDSLGFLVRSIYEEILDEREKSILDVSLLYHDSNNPYSKIPQIDLNEICEQWGITTANFRQIKRRALKKLEDHISTQEEIIELFEKRKGVNYVQ